MINHRIELDQISIESDAIIHYGDCQISSYSRKEVQNYIDKFIPVLSLLNRQSFGFSDFPSDKETEKWLALADNFMLATTLNNVVGFAIYQIFNCEKRAVIYQSRGIIPKYQSRGLGRQFTLFANQLLKPNAFSGRSQNPLAIWSTIKSGIIETMCPFDILYSVSEEYKSMLGEVLKHRGCLEKVDLNTGLQKHAFSMGRLGNYEFDLTNKGIAKIENYFQEVGLDRDAGDALYYLAIVKNANF